MFQFDEQLEDDKAISGSLLNDTLVSDDDDDDDDALDSDSRRIRHVIFGTVVKINRAANEYLCVHISVPGFERPLPCFAKQTPALACLLIESDPVEFSLDKFHGNYYIVKFVLTVLNKEIEKYHLFFILYKRMKMYIFKTFLLFGLVHLCISKTSVALKKKL